jgi:hypothetical protein
MKEERILIPEKMYVGIHKNAAHNFPGASMTAWGTDAASKGRMDNVNSWAENAQPILNQPQTGFMIRGRAGKDEWTVIDPRGFCVSVKADHMFDTLQQSTLIKGQILEPCVWGRNKGSNVLLNTVSDTYERSVVITKIANSKTPWKSAHIGNRVTLVNGTQGIYMGKYYHVYMESYMSRTTTPSHNRFKFNDAVSFVILKDQNVRHYKKGVNKELLWISNPKLAVINSTDKISLEDAEIQVNELMVDECCSTSYNSWNKTPFIAFASVPNTDNLTLALEDHAAGDLQSAIDSEIQCWIMLQSGEWGAYTSHRSKTIHTITMHDHTAIPYNNLLFKTKNVTKTSHWGANSTQTQVVEKTFDLSQVSAHHQLKVGYASGTGNTIHRLI